MRFDKKRPVSKDRTQYLMARVFNRIHVEYRRLPPDKFAYLWTLPGLCHIDEKGRAVSTLIIIIIITQEISIAHNSELKAGAQCAHRKTQNELPIKTKTK